MRLSEFGAALLGLCALTVTGCSDPPPARHDDVIPRLAIDVASIRPYVPTRPQVIAAEKIAEVLGLFRAGSRGYECKFGGSRGAEFDQIEQLGNLVKDNARDYGRLECTIAELRDKDSQLQRRNPRSITLFPISAPTFAEVQKILGRAEATSTAFWRDESLGSLGDRQTWGLFDYDAGGTRLLTWHRYGWLELGVVEDGIVAVRLDFTARVAGDLKAWSVWTPKESATREAK